MLATSKPLFNASRQAGVLLHITSLPHGQLGPEAYNMVDTLREMGIRVWQTLPVNMPHGDQSPYQTVSAHAGHDGMISPALLHAQGWCSEEEQSQALPVLLASVLQRLMQNSPVGSMRPVMTRTGHACDILPLSHSGFQKFQDDHAHWLQDFCLFMALRQAHGFQSWHTWPAAYRQHEQQALIAFAATHSTQLQVLAFAQYVFFQQWQSFRQYANRQGLTLFGDIPIFVAYDSADVWAHPQWFKLDASGEMTVVAGVPPDYFSETGQRWGNPHYDWTAMEADGFSWWLGRVAVQAALFDILRIDHFRGLQAAWEIPAHAPTAIEGAWQIAPGEALLSAITHQFPHLTLVAEDLGIITPEVDALRLQFALPGMKILQFAFGGGDDNPYLPEQIDAHSVAYTGTHDNDTTLGWFASASPAVRDHLCTFLHTHAPQMPHALMALTMHSRAFLAIVPMQDILHLDSTARMNTPGTTDGNWTWRMLPDALTAELQTAMRQLIQESGRSV